MTLRLFPPRVLEGALKKPGAQSELKSRRIKCPDSHLRFLGKISQLFDDLIFPHVGFHVVFLRAKVSRENDVENASWLTFARTLRSEYFIADSVSASMLDVVVGGVAKGDFGGGGWWTKTDDKPKAKPSANKRPTPRDLR